MLALLVPLALIGIVVEDQAALRAAPQDGAARPAVLWRGDWLEVRGERAGFLQVYDHRRERPGYVRPYQVRTYPLEEGSAPPLRAVLDFLRDQPGAESLGIGYAALLLRAAPAGGPDLPGTLDALGTLADRLARRASAARPAGPASVALAAQLEVAESYGVRFVSYEQGGRTQVCYDGEALRRLLALDAKAGDPRARARAALALTRPECADPALGPTETQALDEWRLEVLGRADAAKVPPFLGHRLRLRRARVLADLSFQHARRGEAKRAAESSEGAVRELALVSRAELMEEDGPLYDEVAVRVGAARWPGEAAPPSAPGRVGAPRLGIAAGKPGETCVRLLAPSEGAEGVAAGKEAPRLERCTYGLVWRQSSRLLPRGQAIALAVQPLPGWVELWLFRRAPPAETGGAGWRLDLLTPAAADPEVGYVELAGWSPGGDRLLVAREAVVGGALRREFQVLRTGTLAVERQARSPDRLLAFKSWQSPDWRGRTIALR